MKTSLHGLLLAFQFFSSLPVKKELPMNRRTVTAMYAMMPIISLVMGCVIVLLLFINDQYLQFSTLLLAICIVVANIVMTGGLHLDGWIDLGDAYFSYQDKARRLEILEDSRVGAFGAISLVVLMLLKIGFLYEALSLEVNLFYWILIPLISRLSLLIYFLTMKNVKDTGLAAYFKSQVNSKIIWFIVIIYSLILLFFSIYLNEIAGILLFIGMLFGVYVYRLWTKKNFGGMTGDLLGAIYEGMELFLWGILLLFI